MHEVVCVAVSRVPQGAEAGNRDYNGTTKVNLIGGGGMADRFEVHFVSDRMLLYKYI